MGVNVGARCPPHVLQFPWDRSMARRPSDMFVLYMPFSIISVYMIWMRVTMAA
jgi:hypothetical protein